MCPLIREIVSAVTYQNMLRDSDCVRTRNLDLRLFYSAIPELQASPVLVYDHKYLEEKVNITSHLVFGITSTKFT